MVRQVAVLTDRLIEIEDAILTVERELDDFIYELYGLDQEEKNIIDEDTAVRANARLPRIRS